MLLLAVNIGNEYVKIYIKMSENCFHGGNSTSKNQPLHCTVCPLRMNAKSL